MLVFSVCPIEGIKLYDKTKEKGLSKFLYFCLPSGAEIILIGEEKRTVHKQMCSIFFMMKEDRVYEEGLFSEALAEELWRSKNTPTGAGICTHVQITSWMSEGFGVTTPDELRQKIADALGLPLAP